MIIDDVSCEAFPGLGLQILVTAKTKDLVQIAVDNFAALPSTILGGVEGGIGQFAQGLDHRPGRTCQLWVMGTGNKSRKKLAKEFAFRVRQALMTTPTIAIFNALDAIEKINVTESVGYYGDGYETIMERFGRKFLSIPMMMGHDFLIEQEIAFKEGVMGGFLWLYCDSIESALSIGQKAVDTVRDQPNVGGIFSVCPCGSKLNSINHLAFGASTNHILCPTLRGKIADSRVPPGVLSIPEIVLNAFDLPTLKKALKAVISSIQEENGLIRISSRSFGNQLGNYSINLRDL